MTIRFGPAGLGPVKTAVQTLEHYASLGLRACEIAFTYGIYIKKKEDVAAIRKAAERLDISLSIHGPYWINLNSAEPAKIAQSKERIINCCKIGHELGATVVVFHPAFYGKRSREDTYVNVKKNLSDVQKELKRLKLRTRAAPEIMGKVNVFGSIEEISTLVDDTKSAFCIDYAHILARYKEVDYPLIEKAFANQDHWHVHFSGIEYGEKGEKKHLKTPVAGWKELLDRLPKKKDMVIINESPDMVEDSVVGLKLWKKR